MDASNPRISHILDEASAGKLVQPETLAELLGIGLPAPRGAACAAYPLSLPAIALQITTTDCRRRAVVG